MLRENKHRRFPRSAYMRRVQRLYDECALWKTYYREHAAVLDSPVLAKRASDKAAGIDDMLHALDEVLRTLWYVA